MGEILWTALFIYAFLGLVIAFCCYTPEMFRFDSPYLTHHLAYWFWIAVFMGTFVIGWLPLVIWSFIEKRFPDEDVPVEAEPPSDFGPGYDR